MSAATMASTNSFINPGQLLGLAVAFMDVTFILLLFRGVTIRMTRRKIYPDDWTLLVAGVLTIAMCINMITASAYKIWGISLPITLDHKTPITMAIFSPQLQQNAQFQFAQQLMFIWQMTFARLTIVLFYRRTLVPEPFGVLHWATMTVSGVLGLWLVSFFFAYLFQCGTHFPVIWQGPALLTVQVCVNNYLELCLSATGVLLDLIIVFLPIHRIITLKLSTAKKLQVASAFMLGLLSVVGATVRLAAVSSELLRVKNVFTSSDPAMATSLMAYWQAFEAGFAFIAASLPGLRPLINHVATVVGSTWASSMAATKGNSVRKDSDAASFSSTSRMVKMTINNGQISKV